MRSAAIRLAGRLVATLAPSQLLDTVAGMIEYGTIPEPPQSEGFIAVNAGSVNHDRRRWLRHQHGEAGRALRLAGTFASGLAIIYAVPHVWWGLGVDWLAPSDMRSGEGLGSHPALTLFAFHGMGALALLSAALTRDMTRPGPSRFPSWFLALHGWGIAILLLIRGGIGLTETALVLTGVRDCPFVGCGTSEPGRASIGMTGVFWEPLFVIWGMALLTTVALWSGPRGEQ